MKQELQNIRGEFEKIARELKEKAFASLSRAWQWLKNFFIGLGRVLHPRNVGSKIKGIRWEDIRSLPRRTWEGVLRNYPDSTRGWILTAGVFLLALSGVVSLLPVTPAPPRPVAQKITTPELKQIAEEAEPPDPEEGLHVVAYTPGGEVPTGQDGVKVLFDHSMVQMSEVDPDRHPKIPFTITPEVPGQFVWYGTKGFFYRFLNPLPPATTFRAKLPKGLKALDGKTLDDEFSWQFSTPRPRIVGMAPLAGQDYVPATAPVRITFNQPMSHTSVEKGFQCVQWKKDADPRLKDTQDCDLDFRFSWEKDAQGREVFKAEPGRPYPPERSFEIRLPKEIPPASGDLGLASSFAQSFSTGGKMALTNVYFNNVYPTENEGIDLYVAPLEGTPLEKEKTEEKKESKEEKEEKFYPTGDLCFRFTNPVDRKSFESAVQLVPLSNGKPDPTFRIGYYYSDEVTATEEEKAAAETPSDLPHLTACLSTDLKFHSGYEIRFSKPVTDRAGQPMDLKPFLKPLSFQTMHAALEGKLNITKTLMSSRRLPTIPFTSMNAERLSLRVLSCGWKKAGVDQAASTCVENYDQARNAAPSEGEVKEGEGAEAEKEEKDPAVREIPIPADYDTYYQGRLDLAKLYPDLKPGSYAIEATFHPMSEITVKKKLKTFGIEQEKLVQSEPVTSLEKIVLSETVLAMKKYENKLFIWAVDLATGEPRMNLPLQVWNGEILSATGFTDKDGIFQFLSNALYDAYSLTVMADDPKSFGFVRTEDEEGLNPDAFGFSASSSRFIKSYFTFLHTDRPLYRAGQVVHFAGFLRSVRDGVYSQPSEMEDVQVTLTDPEGNQLFDKKLPLSSTGAFHDEWTLEEEGIPSGRYLLEAKVPTLTWNGAEDSQTFRQAFYVASYKKPDFKVSLQPERNEYLSGEPIRLMAKGEYFFGAPLSGAQVAWSIRREGFRFQPERYPDYFFVDEEEIQKVLKRTQEGEGSRYEEEEVYEGDGQEVLAGLYAVDSDGRLEDPKLKTADRPKDLSRTGASASVSPAQDSGLGLDGLFQIDFTPDLKDYPTSQIYTATLTAKEWGTEVSAVSDVKVHASSVYVGLKPETRVVMKGAPLKAELVALNPQGEAVPGQALSVSLYKRDYMTIKKRDSSGNWVFESEPKDTLVKEMSLKTDAEGRTSFQNPAGEGGAYRIVAKAEDAQGRIARAAVSIGVGGEPEAAWERGAENRIALIPDKARYRSGETAQLLIPFPTTGLRGLMTVERDGVRRYEALKFEGSQNTLSVPLTEDDPPNVYVSLLLFRPQGLGTDPTKKDLPALMKVGLQELVVDPDKKKLTVALEPEKSVYAPQDKAKIKVRTTDGDGRGVPADLIVSVADESVLRLIDYRSPDLTRRFYYPRKLGVKTAENMIHFKSGDAGDLDSVERKKRTKFLDTAFFSAQIKTDEKGEGTVEFSLPDNLTTWIVEAFAVSEDTKVGSTFLPLKSTLPTFLRPSLPRFLSVEDEVKPVVFVENPSTERFEGVLTVTLQNGDTARLTTPPEQNVVVDGGSRTALSFGLKGEGEGSLPLTFSVRRQGDSKALDTLEQKIPVYDRSMPILLTASGATRERAVEVLTPPPGAKANRGGLTVTVGTTPARLIRDAMDSLFQNSYDSAERRISKLSGLWQLLETWKSFEAFSGGSKPSSPPDFLKKLYSEHFSEDLKDASAPTLGDVRGSMVQTLSSLYPFQLAEGGFALWQNETFADPFLSGDVARLFKRLGDSGIVVNPNSKEKLSAYLADLLSRQSPGALLAPTGGKKFALQSEAEGRAVLAWSLSHLDPEKAHPTVKSLLEVKGALGPRGLSTLALAIRAMGGKVDPEEAMDLVDRLEKQARWEKGTQGDQVSWVDPTGLWDPITTTAVALQALTLKNASSPAAQAAARFLVAQAKKGSFGNARATREALMALRLSSLGSQKDKGEIPVSLAVGSREKTAEMAASSPFAWLEESFTIDQLRAEKSPIPIRVSKPSEKPGALYYQSTLASYFPIEAVPRKEEGLIVAREFYAMDDLKEEKPLTRFKLGDNFKAVVTVLSTVKFSDLVVENPLPAGMEPVDFGFDTTSPELKTALLESLESELKSPVLCPQEFGHEEIQDDKVSWVASRLGPGIYKFRHVVKAASVGRFQAPGATTYPLYDSRFSARSRSYEVEVTPPPETFSNKP